MGPYPYRSEHPPPGSRHHPTRRRLLAGAHRHYFVYKTDKQGAERTITQVRELNKEQRVKAIATMLSQNPA